MKIIANTVRGYILEATEDEIAKLVGYKGIYNVPSDKKSDLLKIGTVVEVDSMFDQLYTLEHNKAELSKVSDKLRKYADNLEAVRPILPEQDKS